MILAVTATGKDRPGIIAAITGVLYQAGGNLEDASMTILEGEFAMICLASVHNRRAYSRVQTGLKNLSERFALVISVKAIKHRLFRGEQHRLGTTSWTISASGKDRAGIVYHISKTLADRGLNITDLHSKILGTGRKTAYVLMLEVDLPKRKEVVQKLKKKLKTLQQKLQVQISVHPVEVAQF